MRKTIRPGGCAQRMVFGCGIRKSQDRTLRPRLGVDRVSQLFVQSCIASPRAMAHSFLGKGTRFIMRRTRSRRGHSEGTSETRPQAAHVRGPRPPGGRGRDGRAARPQTGGAEGGPRGRVGGLRGTRSAGDRGPWPGHAGARADPLHLRDNSRTSRAAAGPAGRGSEGRDRAARDEQPRRPAPGARVRAPAHRGPGRSGKPPRHSRHAAPQPGSGGGRGPFGVPRCQADGGRIGLARGQGAHLDERGQPSTGSAGGAGHPVQGRAGTTSGDDRGR